MKIILILSYLLATQIYAQAPRPWQVKYSTWDNSHEQIYQDFIKRFAQAAKNKSHKCNTHIAKDIGYGSQFECFMNDPQVNIWRALDPKKAHYYSDCADCPYILRAYVAYQNSLPFSYIKTVTPRVNDGKDPRYSTKGNTPAKRAVVTSGTQAFGENLMFAGSGSQVNLMDIISTAMYRIGPVKNNDEIVSVGGADEQSDFFPLKLDRSIIKRGDVIYSSSGHAMMIDSINENGTIDIFQCHTNGYVTAKRLTPERLLWSHAYSGFGIKAWRPFHLLENGSAQMVPNSKLTALYSTQQYRNKPSEYIYNNKNYSFWDFLKINLAGGIIQIDPINEVKTDLTALCNEMDERVMLVQDATNLKIHTFPFPYDELPSSIYQTNLQPWENISSPGRDQRIRQQAVMLQEKIKTYIKENPSKDFSQKLLKIYQEKTLACKITYQKSNGISTTFTLKDFLENRLYKNSFDPYHCPERRWGAYQQAELASCVDYADKNAVKERWYFAQQTLRNSYERIENVDMSWTLLELESILASGSAEKYNAGRSEPVKISIENLLKN